MGRRDCLQPGHSADVVIRVRGEQYAKATDYRILIKEISPHDGGAVITVIRGVAEVHTVSVLRNLEVRVAVWASRGYADMRLVDRG